MFLKYFNVLGFLLMALINVISVESISPEDLKQMTVALIKKCQEKTGASEADLAKLKERVSPETKEGVCMFHCFLESYNAMDEQGNYNKDALATALTPLMNGDAEKIAKVKEMTEYCEKQLKDGDKCERGKVLMQCTVDEGKKFGFEYPNDF